MTGWYHVSDTDSSFVRQLEKTDKHFNINPFPIVTAEDFITLSIIKDNPDNPFLQIKFNERGTEFWSEATKNATGNRLALIVNDKLFSTPYVNVQITNGVSALFGNTEELEKIKQTMEENKAEISNNQINK
jgi:preprotein translocase subunit SecD